MKARILVAVFAALAFPAAALAKGPVAAYVSGPGLRDVAVPIAGIAGGGTFVQETGFFAAVFGQSPDPMLDARPEGDLGPRYTISYRLPGPDGEDTIRQDVYPYAEAGPVTYMKPGQPFFGMDETRGGWFRGSATLKQALVAAGLPRTAPSGGSGSTFTLGSTWSLVTGIALALLAGTGLVTVRHRLIGRPAR